MTPTTKNGTGRALQVGLALSGLAPMLVAGLRSGAERVRRAVEGR